MHFHSRKCIRKCRLVNGGHFVSASMCYTSACAEFILGNTNMYIHLYFLSFCDGIWNHGCLDCLLKCLFRCRSKKISKLCIIGLCEVNPVETGGFPAQRASNTENVSIWWRHHAQHLKGYYCNRMCGYNVCMYLILYSHWLWIVMSLIIMTLIIKV